MSAQAYASDRQILLNSLESTLLAPLTDSVAVRTLVQDALRLGMRGVCVNPRLLTAARTEIGARNVACVTVVGFPLGALPDVALARETTWAVDAGADELDMVAPLGEVASGKFDAVTRAVRVVVDAAAGRPVKVILEPSLFPPEVAARAAEAAVEGGARFLKTCTGFLGTEARVVDVALLARIAHGHAGVKASGGIRSWSDAERMLQAGATRIGTSRAAAILVEFDAAATAPRA